MKQLRHLFTLSVVVLLAACGSIGDPEKAVNDLDSTSGISASQIDTLAAVLSLFPNGTQFAVAFIDDTAAAYYGALRENDTLKTIDNTDAVFEIGSLSKVFTATLLADRVIRGKLALDHPVRQYLDIPLYNDIPFTFRQLANHTSGLPRVPSGFVLESLFHMDNPYKDYDEVKLRNYMANEMVLKTEPGTAYQYSNIGFGILGYVLAEIENRTYGEMLRDVVFLRLGMKSSTTDREAVSERLVTGLDRRGNPTSNWDLAAIEGAGAILSTAEDLAKFGIANFDPADEVFKLQREKTFTVDEGMEIALGWHILKRDSGERWHFHNGGTGGYRSSMSLNAEAQKGIVILSNVSPGHARSMAVDSLGFSLLESLQKLEGSNTTNTE